MLLVNLIAQTQSLIGVHMIKTTKPEFRIFRSTRSRSLYSVHQVDSKENSLVVMKSDVSFDEAQETMLQLNKIEAVVAISSSVEFDD